MGSLKLAKATFMPTEGTQQNKQWKVMFNPSELQFDKTVSWSAKSGHSENPAQEFKEPQSANLACTLYFDTFEAGKDTDVNTTGPAALIALATIDSALGRPPVVLFGWGTFTFKGVMESVSIKYTMFNNNGTPVRCEAAIKMKSADSAEVATKKE